MGFPYLWGLEAATPRETCAVLRLQGQGGRWFGGAAVRAERNMAGRLGMSILVLDGITGLLPLHEPFMWLKEQKTQSTSIKFMLDPQMAVVGRRVLPVLEADPRARSTLPSLPSMEFVMSQISCQTAGFYSN